MKSAEMPPCRSPRLALRAGLVLSFAIVLALGAPPEQAAAAAPQKKEKQEAATASWALLEAVTTVGLDTRTLSGLGLEVTGVEPTALGHAQHPLSVAAPDAPSFTAKGQIDLHAAVAVDGFHGFEGGSLHHRGGFRLRGPAGSFDLSSLELRPGRKSTTLELIDAAGEALLTTADAQWELDKETGELRYLNADLRPTLALARKLGDDRYTTVTVGVLNLDATLQVGDIPPGPPIGINAPPPCGDWSGNVDVGLVNMSSIAQAGIATVNGRSVVVVLPSAELENVGTANVPWYSKFTNLSTPPWNDQHPFLVWQMTRSSGGVFEPLGRSDLKHAFLTINSGCDAGACTDSHVLGIGCADVYGTSTNNSVGSLAPRAEVTASTGIWSHCGGIATHFDTNGDCVQDFSGSGENAFTHGLKAAETDLQVAGATYYVEAFYVVRNDVNIFNSMGYRQVTPAKPGSTWTFATVGAYSQGPAINAWVNPTTPGANADNRLLDTGEGRVQLAVRVTTLAGSPTRQRFAYALQNHDFDRRISSFRVPFNTTVGVIENITYADGDGFAANNWTAAVDPTGITWTAPAATTPPAELDYASVISFRFDSDQTAAVALSSLGVFEAGAPNQLNLQTLAPATAAVTPGDYNTVTPCRLLDTRTLGDGATPVASGSVRELTVFGACGVPGNATAVAINVTAVGATNTGYLVVYASTTPPTSSTLTFVASDARTNNAISQLTVDGKLKIQPILTGGGSTHVAVDVVGYFVPGAP